MSEGSSWPPLSRNGGEGVFDLEVPGPGGLESHIARIVDLETLLEAVDVACRRLKGEPA